MCLKLADIDDVSGVSGQNDGIELIGGHAIEHAAHQPLVGRPMVR